MGNRPHGLATLKRKAERGEADGTERALIRVGARNTAILIGEDDLSDWDEEELRRGQRRDKNGRFQGQPPKVVPKAIHDELVRRTLAKAEELMRENLYTAIEALVEIITGQDTEDRDKLKAIDMIMNRVMGKTPDRIQFSGAMKPWEIALRKGIVSTDDDVLDIDDADVVEEE